MKIIQKSLATLLVICMTFSLIPSVMLPDVSGYVAGADDASKLTGSATNKIVGGAMDVDEVVFRTTLSRDPNNYLDGTPEQTQRLVDYYSLRYPNIENPKTNCIYLWPANIYDRKKHDFGISYFGNKDISWDKKATAQELNIRLNASGSSTNAFKVKALADYNAKKITGPHDLTGYKWKNYLPTKAEALDLLSYIFQKSGGSYHTVERTKIAISANSNTDPSSMNKVQKDDVTFGYVGLLTCYYVLVKDSPNTKAIAGNYETSIEEYLGNKNTVEKPVSLINEVCMAMTIDEDPLYNSITMAIPIMEYIRFTLLPENTADMVGDDGAAFLGGDGTKKLTTTQMLEKLAAASAKKHSYSSTYATTGRGLLRIADRGGNYMGNVHSNTALGRVACVAQLYKQIISIDSTSTGWKSWGTKNEYPGFLKMLELEKGSGIYGFSIVSHNVSNPNPDISYYVDDTTQTSFSRCDTEVSLKEPPKITLHINGNSSLISSLAARKNDAGFEGLKLEATVTRNKLVANKQVETNKKMPLLEAEINNLFTKDDLVVYLAGRPITLLDKEALQDKYERDPNGAVTVTYIYNIDIDVTIDKEVYKYKKDDIVTKMESGAPNDFTSCTIPLYTTEIILPEDIVITKPGSTTTTDIVNPSENENLSEMTQMISRYDYTTSGEEFAEIKNNKPLDETYEVMAGVPSSEELYFSVGGSEFKVAMVVQYWMNEHSRDRTYTVHFTGNTCEFNNEEDGKGDRMPLKHPVAQPGDVGKYTDQDIHCLNENSSGGFDGTIVAEWKGRSKCEKIKTGCSVCGTDLNRNHILDTSDYDSALVAANKLIADLGGEIVTWKSASDLTKRDKKWVGSVTTNTYANSDFTSAGSDGSADCTGAHGTCGGHTAGDPPTTSYHTGAAHNAGSPCSGAHDWYIVVTAKIPNHAVCGPCCGHQLPDIYDTWRQGLVYDFAKISQIRLFKLDQGSVDGMTELTGTDRIFASTMSGNPTYFMNIAQLTEKNSPILQDGVTSEGLTASYMEQHGATYFSGANRKLAQSSRAGRLRYILDPDFQENDTIPYVEHGNGQNSSFEIDYKKIAAPEEHDDVLYKAGPRSRNCDGMATTGNFGKSSGNNVKPMDNQGHDNLWADGILYTNIMNQATPSDYFSAGSRYTPKQQKENDVNVSKYEEDYNHHVQRNGLTNKKGYSDSADQKDILTPEWKFFDKARRTKVIVNVISDYLILQTSGGDQSIIYYEKASPATEAQEHFQKVKITEDELFTNNDLSIFNRASTCTSPVLKSDDLSKMIVVGGYNGQYNKPDEKYKPYSLVTGEFLPFAGKGSVYDATTKLGTYKPYGGSQITTILDKDPAGTVKRPKRIVEGQETSFKIYQDGIRIIPTTLNKLYTPHEARVFYPQVLAFFSSDGDAWNAELNQMGVGPARNVDIGWIQWQRYENDYRNRWGTKLGVDSNTVYFGVEDDSNAKTINEVVVYTPVSTEDALVLNQEDLSINGLDISRDQRANAFDYPNLNDMVNKLKVCPLDPELCEYRTLDCKFVHDTVLADFDFSDTYKTMEQNVVDGEVVKQEVVKKNTYFENGNWITTNKTTGLEYVLPTGFSIESGGQVGDGRYLRATGTRWSIPFGDLSLANSKSNRLAVELDLTVNSNANDLMLISFYNYGFVINQNGLPGSFIVRSALDNKKIGARADMSRNVTLNHVKLSLVFGFNSVIDCTATVDGVPATVTVSELRNVWETVGGTQQLQLKQATIKDVKKDPPNNVQKADIGSNLNIGSWGSDAGYRADYYIDNLKVILKGGTLAHNSTCYKTMTVHATNKTHTHTADCYLKEDIYTCNGALNANYQLGCGNSPLNSHVHDATCKQTISSGGLTNYYYQSHYETQNITGYVVTLGGYSYIWPGSGVYVYTYDSQCSRGTNMPSSVLHTQVSSGFVTYDNTSYPGSSGHSTIVTRFKLTNPLSSSGGSVIVDKCSGINNIHKHTGTAGLDYANGCYTKPTIHKHNMNVQTLTCGLPEGGDGKVYNYSYTGNTQAVTLPVGRYRLETWGAEGGTSPNYATGGKGGYSVGELILTKNTTLYINVGEAGITGGAGYRDSWNGGAAPATNHQYSAGGGGATDISLYGTSNNTNWNTTDHLYSRIIVAGGGGGGGAEWGYSHEYAGRGGGVVGEDAGWRGGQAGSNPGRGGTQTNAGGPAYGGFGYGGRSTTSQSGSGGGGWYGGGGQTSAPDAGGGGGSGYVYTVNTAKDYPAGGLLSSKYYLTNTSTSYGTQTGHGRAKITNLDHKHTTSCYKTTSSTCPKEPAGTLVCTGELNTETNFNVHVHNASCLTSNTNISNQAFQANKKMETYVVPYTDEYTIEAYGSSNNNVTGYVKGTVKLTKGTILYISVGTKDGYNGGITDIRLRPPVVSDGSQESEAIQGDSLKSRIFIAGKTAGTSSIRSTASKPITSQIVTSKNSDGNGRVYITPKNSGLGNVLNNIVNGNIRPENAKDYLGDEIYNQIMNGAEKVLHTWSGWTTANDKGFKVLGGYNPLQITGGNLVSSINASAIEFTVDVDISDAKAIKEIRITLDNNTGSPTFGLFRNRNRTDDIFVPVKPNTKNQVVTIKPNWTGRITSLEFDPSAGYYSGSTVVRKIELIGYGNKTSNTGEASYVNTEKVVATAGTVWNFSTGTSTTKLLNKGKYKFEVWGARGSGSGGYGGYSYGDITLTSDRNAYVYVGSTSGYNGGGSGRSSGGGATDIRLDSTSLNSRVIVAGGGGGVGPASGGAGGGGNNNGLIGGSRCGSPGKGGTLYSGGVGGNNCGTAGILGQGGNGTCVHGYSGNGQAGGGGGYYGGGGGGHDCTRYNDYDDSGAGGGSGYVNTGLFTNIGGTTGQNSGNGTAKITALEDIKTGEIVYNFTPLKITYVNPFSGQTQTIINNYDKIPDRLPNGENNPIWLCRFQGLNSHVCQQVDAKGNTVNLCRNFSFLECSEAHHRGEHYGTSNKICWSACEEDDNHKNTKTEVEIDKNGNTETVHLASFLQLDAGFTVYFPNRGDFYGNNELGLAAVQGTRGKGYENNMDTTNWTREKRVRFSFDVIYNDKLYISNQWIELEVPKEYFNFYLPINNNEVANTSVEFEVEAINCGTGVGTNVIGGEKYNNLVDTDYTKTLTTFLKQYVNTLLNAVKKGYKVPTLKNDFTDDYSSTGYMSFFDTKRDTIETALRNSMKKVNQQIEKDFEGSSSANSNINPHTGSTKGINYNAKEMTSNDNYVRVDNKMRSNSMESLHGGYKEFYLDIIGRIGNFAIIDTEDFRFSEFFKTAIVSRGDAEALKVSSNWLVDGVVLKVDDAIQNFYVGDLFDIRGNEASPDTRWLDTYGTQDWMSGQLTETGRDVNNKNLVGQILTNDINNIDVLKLEPLRYGYDTYTSINTMGNYEDGYLQVIPKYYALKLTNKTDKNMPDDMKDLPKGTYIPLDIYINKDGQYIPANVFENARNGNINIGNLPLYDYPFNLDWTSEAERRNYTLDEQAKTKETAEYLKQVFYDYPDGTGSEDVSKLPIASIKEYEIPKGKNNYLGTSQYILMSARQRTFIGSSNSYGNNVYKGYGSTTDFGVNKNKNELLNELLFTRAIQRWHGKLGVPSSSVFIPHGLEPDALTTTYVMNDDYAIICTAEIIAIGNTWTLYYSQPWFTELNINGEKYNTSSHYPGHRVTDANGKSVECPNCLPPIIAVYSGSNSSADDLEIVNTY